MFVAIFKLKSHFQVSHTVYCIMTMKLRSTTPCVSDWPITAQRMQKKMFRNRCHSICESWISKV